MASDPASAPGARRVGSDLGVRVASAIVLIPLALGSAYLGGVLFALFWLAAALVVLWEWNALLAPDKAIRLALAGTAALITATVALLVDWPATAVIIVLVGAAVAGALAMTQRAAWIAAGVPYAAAIVLAPVILRHDPAFGLAAIVLLFAVVWLTDIAAYFAGRLIGGPKLWPRVSPKKTWSGALAGTAAAILGGIAVGAAAGVPRLFPLAIVCFVLSVASQAGDLFESSLKRWVGAKDAGHLIPGHGGVMDRLDGFVAAAFLAAVIGVARGGAAAPSSGLMIW